MNNKHDETQPTGKPWSREIIRGLKAVDENRWNKLSPEILNRLERDRLIDKVEYYDLTERGEEVLNGQ